MKIISKHFLLVLGLILILFKPIPAYAEITEQDNLKVKLQVEKTENPDEVKAILSITNIGIRPISNVNINNIIPEGITLNDNNTLSKTIDTINAGETIKHEFYCKVSKNIVVDEETPDNKDEPTTEPSTDVDNNSPPTDGSNESNESNGTENSNGTGNKVTTSDNNTLLILTTLTLCSLTVLLLSRKKIKNPKQIISLFLCFTLLTSLLECGISVQANEISTKQISIKENLTINETTYTFETKITYELPSSAIVPSGSTITRGQWISKLVELLDLKNQQEIEWPENEYPFNDISDSQYSEDILYAYVNSILIDEGDSFNPNEPATREFATVTSVQALGFTGDTDINCDDVGDITYTKEIELAISLDLITLEGNKFYPSRNLTESESQYIIEGIQGVLKSSEIDDNYDNTIEYKDGVIKLPQDIIYEINGTTITFESNDITNNLKTGDIVVLPTEDPYKITNISITADGAIVETSRPTLEETIDYIDVQGSASADLSTFIPAEGVEIIENNTPNSRAHLDGSGSLTGPGAITLKVDHRFSRSTIAGEVTINIPKVDYKVDIDTSLFNVDVHNAYLKFAAEIGFTGSLACTPTPGEDSLIEKESKPIGKVLIAGVPGVTVVATISVHFQADGTAKFTTSLDGSIGAQILNNKLRAIKTIKANFDLPSLELQGKLGPKLSGLIEICNYVNLIDFSFKGGIGINGAITPHPNMVCGDFNMFLFAELTALDECKIRDWLSLTYTWEIWNASNSPLKKNGHFENLHKVPNCTYGDGTIKGTVANATDRNSFIKDALIQVYRESGNIVLKETTSDANGQYSLSLNAGTYKIKISKNGYISFESIEVVRADEETYIETYLMVGQGSAGETGRAGGKITNAVTGGNVSEATINIRSGWNNTSGQPLITTKTNAEGKYDALLPLGNYTVEMIKDGYITKHYNIYVTSGSSLNQNNTLVPDSSEMPSGDLRIVLTWGEQPRDLDSHLIGPTSDGTNSFHIYYNNKSYSNNSILYADLDLDDTNSYGPETTTIYNMNSTGKYSFYVHDYTNRNSSSSTAMSNSGAKVDVYKGDTLYATYNIPTNNSGTYWHVFDFDAESNMIIPVNSFANGISYNSRNSSLFSNSLPTWEVEEKQAS